jgi:tetratricopeptide (TPR) repeat protein
MSKKRKRSRRRRSTGTGPKPRQPASTAKNYRTERYVEYIFAAELGILQAAKLMPELTDGEVLAAVRKLVDQVQARGLPRLEQGEQPMDPEGLIAWLIVQGWEELFRHRGKLTKRDMAGCLTVVVESIEARMRKPGGRRYLRFLDKFMKRAGVTIQVGPLSELADEFAVIPNLEHLSLAELGDLWLAQPDVLGLEEAFEHRVHVHIAAGKAQEVIGLGQRWLNKTDDPYVRAILHTNLGLAYRRLGDLEQAVVMFQAAQSPLLTYAEAWDQLAKTYREMGLYEQAIQTWRQMLPFLLGPDSRFVHQSIADTCRQMGDLAGEEAALRDLVAASKRGGCLFVGWRARDSLAALAQLADCLRRQGREAEAHKLAARIRRARPHIRADTLADWTYWMREWMRIGESDVPMSHLVKYVRQEPGSIHWIPLLRAVLYDWMGQPGEAARFWRGVRHGIVGQPEEWILGQVRDVFGELLPPSSQLFELVQETPGDTGKRPD